MEYLCREKEMEVFRMTIKTDNASSSDSHNILIRFETLGKIWCESLHQGIFASLKIYLEII
jgi:hypothetical protein